MKATKMGGLFRLRTRPLTFARALLRPKRDVGGALGDHPSELRGGEAILKFEALMPGGHAAAFCFALMVAASSATLAIMKVSVELLELRADAVSCGGREERSTVGPMLRRQDPPEAIWPVRAASWRIATDVGC
jgi:hypothetical protein